MDSGDEISPYSVSPIATAEDRIGTKNISDRLVRFLAPAIPVDVGDFDFISLKSLSDLGSHGVNQGRSHLRSSSNTPDLRFPTIHANNASYAVSCMLIGEKYNQHLYSILSRRARAFMGPSLLWVEVLNLTCPSAPPELPPQLSPEGPEIGIERVIRLFERALPPIFGTDRRRTVPAEAGTLRPGE